MRLSNHTRLSNFHLKLYYTGAFLHKLGASSHSIAHQAKSIQTVRTEKLKKGEHEHRVDGALTYDEVKVVSSLLRNPLSQNCWLGNDE